jgi:cytochrome P450
MTGDTIYDPFDNAPETVEWSRLRTLRQEAATEVTPGIYVLARYADADDALRNGGGKRPEFSHAGGMRIAGTPAPPEEQLMSELDGPRHAHIRRLLMSALQPKLVAAVAPFVRQVAHLMLDHIAGPNAAGTDPVDLVSAFAAPIPAFVVAHLLGLPEGDIERFRAWSDEVVGSQYTHQDGREGFAISHPAFARYLDDLVAERTARPGSDFLSLVVTAEHDGERFAPVQIRTLMMHLIVAGNETTTHLIANLLERLIGHPALYRRIANDRSLLPAAVEESLRLDPPVLMRAVTCVRDSARGSVVVPAGSRVVVSIAAANRDERVFPDPDAFRLDRLDGRRHLSFGAGAHFCPGAQLARVETLAAVDVFLDRVAAPALVPGWRRRKVRVFWANGPQALPVARPAFHRRGPGPAVQCGW